MTPQKNLKISVEPFHFDIEWKVEFELKLTDIIVHTSTGRNIFRVTNDAENGDYNVCGNRYPALWRNTMRNTEKIDELYITSCVNNSPDNGIRRQAKHYKTKYL